MTSTVDLIARVRRELGDTGHPFQDQFVGTGDTSIYDLVETQIENVVINGVIPSPPSVVTLVPGSDYTVDTVGGRLILLGGGWSPLPTGYTLIVNGTTSGLYTDDELADYVQDAFTQHTSGRTVQTRFRDIDGFIKYLDEPMDYANLPAVEDYPVSLLATIMVLWAVATDASTDIDISTADGTNIPRSQRYAQVRSQIDAKTAQYQDICNQLNVGLHRIEVAQLRRVSKTTGRLIPVFREREYDDNELPVRILPGIDERNKDESEIPSPWFGGWGY